MTGFAYRLWMAFLWLLLLAGALLILAVVLGWVPAYSGSALAVSLTRLAT